MRTALRQAAGHTFDGSVIDDVLTGSIRTERLGEKHRQGLGWGEEPFPMRRHERLDLAQQLRACQQVGEGLRIAAMDMMANAALLLRTRALLRIHPGSFLR
jgi:hypothetical protein